MTITPSTAALSPEPIPGPGLGATADDTTETITWADFKAWERQLATTGSCSHPIRLTGRIEAIDRTTGETAPVYDTASEPGGVLHVACGNRRESVCPACSAVYKRDARQLVRAGLAGGKGVPETITAHPCVFATLTAPSFGPVHSRRMRGKTVLPCRPRRDAHARRCPHGRDISCPTRHVEDDPRLGQPMCGDCYDYEAAVLFNAHAGDLWRRFTIYLPRHLARLAGVTQKALRSVLRIRYVKVGEYQARGIVHFHAVIRLDATGRDYQPPPARYTADLLCDAIRQATAAISLVVSPGPVGPAVRQRRGNGEGTIAKRKDGRWCAAIFMPTTEGGEKRVYVYGRTRDEVRDKLTELQEKRRRNIPGPSRSWKLGAYLDYWLEHIVRPSKRWNTYKKYEQTVRLYLNPGLGKRPLTRLRVAEVQAFFNDQIRAGHSVAKVHVMRMVLAAALTRAMREELIFTNVARLATLPAAPAARNRPWSADEARRFLDAAHNDPMYPAFVLLLVYGLRRGEILGLSWDDIDLEDDLIRVDWQLQRIGGQLTRTQVKTDAGQRTLPLLPIARDALLDLALWQSDSRRQAGTAWHETGYVFTTRTGQPIEPRDLARSFERIIRQSGLRPIRLHDLRHTVAQFLKRLRTAPNDAKEILGHARITTTLAIYTTGDEDDQRSALDKISDLLFQEPKKQ